MIIYSNTDTKILEITVDDNSYRHLAIMGDDNVTLHFSLAEHIEIPVGSYFIYHGERYTLERPESLKMKHSRYFEYTIIMESYQAKAKIWKFRNPVDGRLKFSLTAKPKEHLQMFVDNMNRRDSGWEIGDCIDGAEILISYNHAFCFEALGQMASECKTEYEFVGKRVSLRKVEYNKNNPLPLSYGRGNGFKPGVGRSNYGDTPPIEILYVQGGTDNIDASKYGSRELLLPKNQTLTYDGEHFENEDAFNPANARTYVVDDLGLSIRRSDKELSSLSEDSLDCSEIYPKRIGSVSSIVVVDAANNFYDIIDDSIPATLNYEDCLIEGETMTLIFQSGMLSGREFEVKYYHNSVKDKAARRFEIIPAEIDGQTMPNPTFAPKPGDTYAVFKCMLPDNYVCDNATKTGASWDMFRSAVKFLFDNEEQKFSFTGELDGIWAKKDWVNILGKIKLGGYVLFSDERFQKKGVLVRIIGIKEYINNPHSPEIELSNSTVSGSFSTTLKKLESDEVLTDDYHRDAIQFTKRRFRDAKETMLMLEEALLDNFTNSINPIAIQTMQLLIGDERLQFRFVNSKTNPSSVAHSITYDNAIKQLTAAAGIIQHLTIGINTLSSSHAANEYKYWDIPEYTSARLEDGTKKYYLYAKVSTTTQTGVFLLSDIAMEIETVKGYYNLLVGVLNSEYDGERSFAQLYGSTEILPGRITTDRVVSGDGNSYFDMLADAMKLGNVLDFNSAGDGKLRLKGTIIQSQSGEESYIGCYRGLYNSSYTYYNGDEVIYTVNGNTSTYRYIYDTPNKGVTPTSTIYWQIVAHGAKGDKGDTGNYTELRYAKNGSTTTPPSLTKTALNPSGWSITTPSVGTGEYLWMTSAVKTGDDNTFVSQWTTPIRISPYNGKDGKSPAMVYRGIYDNSKTYYGNANRLDCVKFGTNYYIARIDAGAFRAFPPPNTSKWNDFGASFESVATNLLLAENANIAGWIFRNNRLESENGSVYLDGINGKVRLAGTIQYSTGYTGNISDVNLFFLPARTTSTSLTMGYEKEDIGKVCRLYNNSAIGSNGIYYINLCTFGINDSGGRDATFGTVRAILKPQEILEVSCFELPPNSLGGYPICAKWTITGRFSVDNWVYQPSDNTPMGRFPRMLAMGHLYGTNTSASVSGYFFDGRSLWSVFTASRIGEGHYRLSFSSALLGEEYTVMAVGSGTIYGGSNPVYASVQSRTQSYFDVYLGDDSSRNDGSFDFMVFSPYWYYPM